MQLWCIRIPEVEDLEHNIVIEMVGAAYEQVFSIRSGSHYIDLFYLL